MGRELVGDLMKEVWLAGQPYKVGPLTKGQEREIRKVFAALPRPQAVAVEVEGLVTAFFRGSWPEALRRDPDALKPMNKVREIELIHRAIKDLVAEQVREARARVEQWPPPVWSDSNTEGMDLIRDHPDVQPKFLRIVLSKHQPAFDDTAATALLDEIDAVEYDDLMEVVFRRYAEHSADTMIQTAKALEGTSEDPKFIKRAEVLNAIQAINRRTASSAAGGDGATSDPPQPAPTNGSTTPSSTPSS